LFDRRAIVAEARGWIGTPYLHQASLKGAGTDCLGLLRGVWRALNGGEPEIAPPYTPDWAESQGGETLLKAARRHFVSVGGLAAARPGDVLLFRWRPDYPCKHAAIVSDVEPGRLSIIHAYDRHEVAEHALPDAWRRKVAAVFAFPEVC
jgi:NlpC/P60 family putative phage cell wall peptidase